MTKIKVLRFPRGIGAVEGRFTIEIRDGDGKVMFGLEGLEMFDYIGRMKDCRLMRKSGMCSVKESKSIQVMVHMTIVGVFDSWMKGIHKFHKSLEISLNIRNFIKSLKFYKTFEFSAKL